MNTYLLLTNRLGQTFQFTDLTAEAVVFRCLERFCSFRGVDVPGSLRGVDEMTPRSFLELLWQYKPEEQYILIWTLQDKRSHWFTDVTKAAEFVAATTKDLDVYVGVGLSKEDHGPARRCKSEEVSGICGIGTDLDLKSEAHGDKPLPTTLADALSVLPKDMPPTIVVATGNGAHAWWLIKEPHPIETEQERADVARLVARWHTMLRLKSAAKGWVYDRLSDLARVLRIAGTQNHKDAANPKDVTVFNQIQWVKLPKKWEVFEKRILSPEQTAQVMARLEEPNLLICETCLDTGTRISEVTGLMIKHVVLDKGIIRIEQRHCRGDIDVPKTAKSKRTLTLGGLIERYTDWIEGLRRKGPNDWVFPQDEDLGSPRWDSGVRKALKEAARSIRADGAPKEDRGLDFPGFGPHSLRRANITWREEVGGSSIETSKIAGPASTAITEEYTSSS